MNYVKFGTGDNTFYVADPKNWEELKYTLHNEDPIMDYDPNDVPDYSDIAKLF